MPSKDRLKREVERILNLIKRTKFDKWLPLERSFQNLSFGAGIYAIRNRDEVLYVGQANAFRTRFQSGHQALIKMLVDGITPTDIRILTFPLTTRYIERMLDIEKNIIFALQPKYNVRIPTFNEVIGMQLREPTTGHLKEILDYLPDNIVDALENHADTYGLTDVQVIELAIANLLNLDATSLQDVKDQGKLETLAQLKERVGILETVIRQNGLAVPELPD